jgi:hypothetical protein
MNFESWKFRPPKRILTMEKRANENSGWIENVNQSSKKTDKARAGRARAAAAAMLIIAIGAGGCVSKKTRDNGGAKLMADICSSSAATERTREMADFTARLTYDAAREAGALYNRMTLSEYIKTTRDAMGRNAGEAFAACESKKQPVKCGKAAGEVARAYKVKEKRVTAIMEKIGAGNCAYITRTTTTRETNEKITVKFLAGGIKGRMQLLAPISNIEK